MRPSPSRLSLQAGRLVLPLLPVLGLSPLEQRFQIVLDLPLKPCYNTPMKKFSILNPFSAQSIMDSIPANRLDEMVRYFAWMLGVQASSLIIKETA